MHTTRNINSTIAYDRNMHIIRDGYFTSDNLIDAYMKGHNDGCKVNIDIQELLRLVKNSSIIISDFYNSNLKGNGCFSLFMKIMDKVYFIAAIDKKVYFDEEKSRKIYSSAIEIMKENPNVSISFLPCENDESINRNSLKADNYIEVID